MTTEQKLQERHKYHADRVMELVRTCQPELSKLEEWALRHELSSLSQSIIGAIGNSINSLTHIALNNDIPTHEQRQGMAYGGSAEQSDNNINKRRK